ncbi:hypothetical protein LMH73_013095 [Vibrio splendidus]|nr:hypothetical protein [Vibrio splendidus]MCC4880720.1 hypothetical protein [Vibrio splendidus]
MSELASLFNLLKKNSDILEDVYNQGSRIEEASNREAALELTTQRVVYATSEGFRLNPKLRNFFDSIFGKETSSYIDTDFNERKKVILNQISAYSIAKYNNDTISMDNAFFLITDESFATSHQAKDVVAKLRRRANGEFSHIKRIEEKIKLNEDSVRISRDVIEAFRQFGSDDFLLAPNIDHKIYNFIKKELIDPVLKLNAEMTEILNKLAENSIKFKEYSKSNELITAFSDYWTLTPSYEIDDFTDQQYKDSHFLVSTPIVQSAVIDIDSDDNDEFIIATLQKLNDNSDSDKLKPQVVEAPKVEAKEIHTDKNMTIKRSQFELDIRSYLTHVITTKVRENKGVSARAYYKEHQLCYDLDQWLFGVMMYHAKLPNIQRDRFKIELLGDKRYNSHGNLLLNEVIIEDMK